MTLLTYQEALDYLNNFINYEKVPIPPASAGAFNLARVRQFLAELGRPQTAYPSIVIAGTKGKGSTARLIAGALEAAGYRIGLYTQPHLHAYRERMRVNQELIGREELAGLVDEMRPAIDALLAQTDRWGTLTSYEVGTGLALLYFARQRVDLAVLEIGLGGRLDAVNVVEPLVSVIASLSLDHMAVLGDTIEQIAFEKAGIIKPHTPVMVAPQWPAAWPVLERVSQEADASLIRVEAALPVGQPPRLDAQHRVRQFQRLRLAFGPQDIELNLSLLGEHQRINAALAAAALWQQQNRPGGLPLGPTALAAGFEQAFWPARLQVLEDQPGSALVVADGAHNRESAARLRQSLADSFYFEKLWLVAGVYSDKDVIGIFEELLADPAPVGLVLTRSRNPRAIDPADLAERLQPLLTSRTLHLESSPSVKAGLKTARQLAGPHDLILVTGSLSVAAEAEEALSKSFVAIS